MFSTSRWLFALSLLLSPLCVQANVAILGSRVIYNQARHDVDVQLQQVGPLPGFVQIWLDEGDDTRVDGVNPAFTLAPSIARMDPGGRQIVRIVHSREGLPEDRESLLWLNILETPLAADGPRPGVRTRLKFFYRPSGLPSSPESAHQSLQFSLQAADDGQVQVQVQVRVINPSPYHVTFRELTVHETAGTTSPVLAEFSLDAPGERMVAPMSELVLPLAWTHAPLRPLPLAAAVVFSIINDGGGASAGQQPIVPALESKMMVAGQ